MKFKTNFLLRILAVANLLMIPIIFWSIWQIIEMAIFGKAFSFLANLVINAVGVDLLIVCITAWAFFKGWKWLLLLYIPYSIYTLPKLISEILNYLSHSQLHSPFYFRLFSYTFTETALLLATLLTAFFFLFETYRSRKNFVY